MKNLVQRVLRRLKYTFEYAVGARNSYFEKKLQSCSGILHVGANVAQEYMVYDRLDLNVVWVEGLPDLADRARKVVSEYPKQSVVEAVVSDTIGQEITMNRASNNGASSSIMDYKDEMNLWPELEFVETITLKSNTIDNLLSENVEKFSSIDACLMDIQGAELLALKGARQFLKQIKIISVETSEMEVYEGDPTPAELAAILTKAGFTETKRNRIAGSTKTGFVYDGIWERV